MKILEALPLFYGMELYAFGKNNQILSLLPTEDYPDAILCTIGNMRPHLNIAQDTAVGQYMDIVLHPKGGGFNTLYAHNTVKFCKIAMLMLLSPKAKFQELLKRVGLTSEYVVKTADLEIDLSNCIVKNVDIGYSYDRSCLYVSMTLDRSSLPFEVDKLFTPNPNNTVEVELPIRSFL